MGRIRKIKKDDILDAAERVVMKLGAAGLSIDAVAQEAGVSKSTVVYDHKSKSALLCALIDRRVSAEQARQEQAIAGAKDTPHPELFGRLKAAEREIDDVDRAVAMAIGASVSHEEELHHQLREWTAMDIKAMSTGPKPEAALLALLALTGFQCNSFLGFHRWKPEEQARILESIRNMYATYPET
ncbi:TetR/AcrR family transcriptional regulator [Rhizobium sp. C4]|uniref:TetR/AcrR family transcriptional regulator n=1 Tax=Rhizobium sp. C4 TaxID=1349800 RepID=UPI001E45A871|nr:TetR/AcrR family transcriptional regulator [Rhizobium sp. C4]MCD2174354.1 TetR/AcrR family transcriptional regulator [Rhizobium sp. C4]